ncbi:hypothetical protein MKZ38_007307 [Zalerion maritima]|uniref:Uncharacterized protein n=1 Tax=Zalerion maritima TaxID=339359 RepID=A0AAD5RMU3_9PEZI|nr:hypothetical protein MKZ38_007307 [Zalerion maritima]
MGGHIERRKLLIFCALLSGNGRSCTTPVFHQGKSASFKSPHPSFSRHHAYCLKILALCAFAEVLTSSSNRPSLFFPSTPCPTTVTPDFFCVNLVAIFATTSPSMTYGSPLAVFKLTPDERRQRYPNHKMHRYDGKYVDQRKLERYLKGRFGLDHYIRFLNNQCYIFVPARITPADAKNFDNIPQLN